MEVVCQLTMRRGVDFQVMHYLDTVRPQSLLAQMLSTVFVAAVDIQHRSFSKALQPLSAELEDLYSSMAAVLQPLEVVSSSGTMPLRGSWLVTCATLEWLVIRQSCFI